MINKRRNRAQRTLEQPSNATEEPVVMLRRMRCLVPPLCFALAACTTGSPPRNPNLSAEARLQVAEAADASGDSELAIATYTAAAADNPGNIDLQLRCADALARAGKIDEARKLLQERLRAHPNQPDLTRALALVDLVAGRLPEAIAGLDRVLALNPDDTRALVDKAVALDLQRQHAAAQSIYRQVLARSPDDATTRNNLALSLMLEGQARQALETLAPMQSMDSTPQRLKINLGILYAANGNAERSRELLGDSVSQADLLAVTHALAPASADPAKIIAQRPCDQWAMAPSVPNSCVTGSPSKTIKRHGKMKSIIGRTSRAGSLPARSSNRIMRSVRISAASVRSP
jgi:Flp pilus assembly protein TadD